MNKQEFETMVERLHDHHIKCEGNAGTSHPIFSVQRRRLVSGIDPDYSWDIEEVYDANEGESYDDLLAYFQQQDEDYDKNVLPKLLDLFSIDLEDEDDIIEYSHCETCAKLWETYESNCAIVSEQDVLDEIVDFYLLDVRKVYSKVIWEDVTYFLTREPAEEFCDKFAYRHGNMRVYVKSGWESDQYKGLIKAMLDGNLVWKE